MAAERDLEARLDDWASSGAPRAIEVAAAVAALAVACVEIAGCIAQGGKEETLSSATGRRSGIDEQKRLDVLANDVIVAALARAPVAALASEELDAPLALEASAPLLAAVDPIDGSSNIEANVSIGTIFSLLPAPAGGDLDAGFRQPGTAQLAAGFAVYGPQTTLALTLGAGTDLYALDPVSRRFVSTRSRVQIPPHGREYAINTSNYRHWDAVVRTYVNDCMMGEDGPRGEDFNMRWTASPVADVFRILARGGVFLYPGDGRKGYTHGRLRLLYEANPIGLVVEQAGGAASTGEQRILDLVPHALHERVPVVIGSRAEVALVERLYREPNLRERSPLFGRRGLLRDW
jgi:fructose-1,6-bisphosphatase I